MISGFIYSLLIHAALLSALILSSYKLKSGSDGPHKGGGANKPTEIAPKPSDSNAEREMTVTLTIPIKRSKKTAKHPNKRDCRDYYGGVGIMHSDGGIITSVPSGYPAANAGIILGDTILNPDELRGDPGTRVTAIILRRGQEIAIPLIRDKICTIEVVRP